MPPNELKQSGSSDAPDDASAVPPTPFAATATYGFTPLTIQRALPNAFPTPLPLHLRLLSCLLPTLASLTFLMGPIVLALPPFLYLVNAKLALALLVANAWLVLMPVRPRPGLRKWFQLLYRVFDVHHNVGDASVMNGSEALSICAMHPHGVIPIQGFIWVAFCDQYLGQLYGYGATTDLALKLPFLRQILQWLSTKSANRSVVRSEILDAGRNLYILPGGVAEIFMAEPGRHVAMTKRRGLMKLALQTGASLTPVYVFGGNDFFHQLATYGGAARRKTAKSNNNSNQLTFLGEIQMKMSRILKGGFTFFWGKYGLPIPLDVKVTMVLGDPIAPVLDGRLGDGTAGMKKTWKKIDEPSEEQIEDLTRRYTEALRDLFEQYKVLAGYPDAELELC